MLSPTSLLQLLLLTAAAATSASAFPDLPPPFVNPWLSFQNLSGCHMGDERPGLADLKDYLSHFGYLPSPPPFSNFSDSFDEELDAAIRTYQRNFGLNVTGTLDPSTVDQMITPRCGVADVINGTSTMNSSFTRGRNLFAYFAGNPTWPPLKRDLKYALTATSNTAIDKATLSAVFARAFARWSAATTLTFAETESASDADMTIGFYYGAHGDGEPFDGVLGTLAHAFSPTDGRFHLDAAEAWVAEGDVTRASSDTAVDLESVAVHEIGHLLGMGHSVVAEAVMYPTIKTRTRKVDLARDDVEGIQQLYGSNPNFKGVAPSTTGSSPEMETSDAGGAGGGGRWGWRWLVVVAAVGLVRGESLLPCTSFF
ncbi:Metalloendoproteinase 2-MMP [Ananas comosus]|uniref:Metalloendoproteinase 2-MMP n=1 Tax=Ananas comosus TaxID=4615 RepID=A0A199VQ92_ANACO|nr:Metalloendoproteinase 2-MMP [Ananas comosus]